LVLVSIVDREFEFTFFGPEDDGLTFHAADHIEGCLGFAAQGHFQQVFFDAGFNGLAQLGCDFEEPIGRTQAFNALVRPLVVVILDPKFDPLSGGVKALELGPAEELLPERFPEALDFSERHGMVRPGLDVVGPVLFHLGLEAGGAPPVHKFPAVVGEHLFGRLVFAGRDPKHLQDVFGRVAAKQIGPHDEARVVIHKGDDIGVTAAQPEGEDVSLPHLVGRGALEEPGAHQVASRLGRWRHQALLLERLADGRRTGLQKEHPLEQLGDALDAPGGLFFLEFDDLVSDRLGQAQHGCGLLLVLQSLFAVLPIALHPLGDGGDTDPQLLGNQGLGEALFEVQLDGSKPILKGPANNFFRRSPPRGGGVVLLLSYWFILLHVDTFLSLKCQPISALICSHEMVASTMTELRRNAKAIEIRQHANATLRSHPANS
jgi:hypothetical protein